MSGKGAALVTGGTGLLGGHLAEQLTLRGYRVRALVRTGSDVRFLNSLGVDCCVGDLSDPSACVNACNGMDVVYHAAAKVGDWGPWSEFQTGVLDATRNLATAALRAGVRRFVHISSTSAYGHPRDTGVPLDESAPLGVGIWLCDHYTRSKVMAEQLLWKIADDHKLGLTVIRPSWLYGERDRITMPRLLRKIQRGEVPLIGRGDNPLSAVYAGIVADAAILAAENPAACGEAYNITDQGMITQKDFLNLIATACGAPAIRKRHSYRFVFLTASCVEFLARVSRRPRPPFVTRYATWIMGRSLAYNSNKARTQLGWTPRESYETTIDRTVRWFLDSKGNFA